MYTVGSGTQDGVNSGTAAELLPRESLWATASNLDTLLDRLIGRRVRMLLSFQRPPHLFGGSALPECFTTRDSDPEADRRV
jgi:hypothetical protein